MPPEAAEVLTSTASSAKMASKPNGRGLYPTLVNGYTLDKVLIVVSLLFISQHPSLQGLPMREPELLARQVTDYVGNITTALKSDAQRPALLHSWYEYTLGSDLGGEKNNNNPKLRAFYELNEWKNSLILPKSVRDALPHTAAVWLRNYVAIHFVYFGIGFIWAAYIYWLAVDRFFPKDPKTGKRDVPSWESLRAQMWVSWWAMPMYVLMPTASEWLAERGIARAVHSFEEMGGIQGWLVWSCVYLFFVEWGIYWVHRGLHEVRWAYKLLHYDHHIYNNAGDLSPFAGLAFHPVDGMLQAAPYLVFMLCMPVHFWTHTALLFFTGVWTTNIHDTLNGNTEPVMGSKYHTYHHTAYVDNYGQFFVFFDWVHNTLTDPHMRAEELKAKKAA